MTKIDFLKRCATAYDMYLINENNMQLMGGWLDAIMRYEASLPTDNNQRKYFDDFIERERVRTNNFDKVLVRDREGYDLIKISAILSHKCQICAEDSNAWHTRQGFCNHSDKEIEKHKKYNFRKFKISNLLGNE